MISYRWKWSRTAYAAKHTQAEESGSSLVQTKGMGQTYTAAPQNEPPQYSDVNCFLKE